MIEWLTAPKSITVILGALIITGGSIWQSRMTAALVAELLEWRLEAVKSLSDHEARIKNNTDEIERLRNLREGR